MEMNLLKIIHKDDHRHLFRAKFKDRILDAFVRKDVDTETFSLRAACTCF